MRVEINVIHGTNVAYTHFCCRGRSVQDRLLYREMSYNESVARIDPHNRVPNAFTQGTNRTLHGRDIDDCLRLRHGGRAQGAARGLP